MLLHFSVANHLSIKDAQALSLTASSLKDVEDGLIDCAAAPGGRILPAAVIYGANASGKSNVVAALRFMRNAVLFSHRRGEPGGGVPRTPFALDPACTKAPTILTADFVVEGVRYHYGFKASDENFANEWLYGFSGGRRQMLSSARKGALHLGAA